MTFLSGLAQNNHKEWFQAHRAEYDAAQANVLAFVQQLLLRMQDHDKLSSTRPKDALYRIYSDTRFHKDKSPYNPRFLIGVGRLKPYLRGGYTLRIQPGNSQIGCGFFGPNADDLKRIRQDIDRNFEEWQAVLAHPSMVQTYGTMLGQQLKTAPQGYSKDHAAVQLLRYKQFIFRHAFTDAEVLAPDFVARVDACFRDIRPFFDHMSELLTTDGNGISLY